MTKTKLPALVYGDQVITQQDEMLSLTDMWRADGSSPVRQPSEWLRSSAAKRFIAALSVLSDMGNSQLGIVQARKGGAEKGTYAHWQVALAYAKYLSPEFHMWCNTVVRERMEGRDGHGLSAEAQETLKRVFGMCQMLSHKVTEMERAQSTASQAETKAQIKAQVTAEIARQQHSVVSGVSAGQVLAMAGIRDRKGLRGLPVWVSHRLRRFHAKRGEPTRLASLGSRSAYVFDPLLSREWLARGGKDQIERKIAERRAQYTLNLVPFPQPNRPKPL